MITDRSTRYSKMSLLGTVMSQGSNALGKAGELYAELMLQNSGYDASIDHQYHYGDIRVRYGDGLVLRCEVKTARCGSDGRYSFLLHGKRNGRTETLCTSVHFLALLAVTVSGLVRPFIVPRWIIGDISFVKIGKAPKRGLSKYTAFEQSTSSIDLSSIEETMREFYAQIPF